MEKREIFIRKNTDGVREAWMEKACDRTRYSKNTWIGFIISTLKNSSVFSLIYRITSFIRRISFISTAIAVIKVILVALSTSAFFVFFIAVTIAVLPFIATAAIFAAVHTAVSFRYYNRVFRQRFKGKTLYVFFPSRDYPLGASSRFSRSVRSFSEQDAAVVIVSPYSFSPKGIGGKRYFMTCRRESKNIYIIRRRYFFIFKRKILTETDNDTFLIY